jgi:hypothetical protein
VFSVREHRPRRSVTRDPVVATIPGEVTVTAAFSDWTTSRHLGRRRVEDKDRLNLRGGTRCHSGRQAHWQAGEDYELSRRGQTS